MKFVRFVIIITVAIMSCSETPTTYDLHIHDETESTPSYGSVSGIFRIDSDSVEYISSELKIGFDILYLIEYDPNLKDLNYNVSYNLENTGIRFTGTVHSGWDYQQDKFYIKRIDSNYFISWSETKYDFIINIKDLPLGNYTMYIEYEINSQGVKTKTFNINIENTNLTLGEIFL